MLLWRQKSKILFKACNFRFAFLHTVLRCSVKSSLLSIMTPKSFSEALFLIVILLHLKLGKVSGIQGVNQKITIGTVRPQLGKRALARPNVAGGSGGWGAL